MGPKSAQHTMRINQNDWTRGVPHLLERQLAVAVSSVTPGVLLDVRMLVVVDADTAVAQACGEVLNDARLTRAKKSMDRHTTEGSRIIG